MSEIKTATREELLAKLAEDKEWDVVIIGGGATGAGIAVDAASRGFSTLIVDAQDWSSGTSSRSTKLIHGGVRYMANPRDWPLVFEALKERKLLCQNAPHLVHPRAFILPAYGCIEREYYFCGLTVYSMMAYGGYNIGKTEWLSKAETLRRLPGVKPDGLYGGVQFWDGQFDDARLNVALIRTAYEKGAVPLNYMEMCGAKKTADGSKIESVTVRDRETGKEYTVRAKMVFNAAGCWVDPIRRMVDPNATTLVEAARGSHIVLDIDYMSDENGRQGDCGMFIPKTPDGRVMFALPWHGVLEVGTTDHPEPEAGFEPEASEKEINMMIETTSRYLRKPLKREDIKATFCGLRPLYNPKATGSSGGTAKVSREHSVIPEYGNMITVTGGKWTAYRNMAQHALSVATERGLIEDRPCTTRNMPIFKTPGFDPEQIEMAADRGEGNPEQVMAYAKYCRDYEFARTAEDFAYRRLRLGQMNIAKAKKVMEKVKEVFGR